VIYCSQDQVEFAHELKKKLDEVRPALDDASKAAQFKSAFDARFPGAEIAEEMFAAEFEHVAASVRVKELEKSPEPEKSLEPGA